MKSKFNFWLKENREFWNYAKNQDFFGLKVKYVVWIIPIPFVGWFVVGLLLVKDTRAKTLKPIIAEALEKGSIIVTDEWGGYNGLSKDFKHEVVKHNESEYVKNGFHTNTMEGFWSLLKRGIFGIYHSASPKHLNTYCDEFSYRYNTRNITDGNRFYLSLINANERLPYKELIG